MELFITGFNSGLGRFLVKKFNGREFDPRHSKSVTDKTPKNIIHCGYQYPSVHSVTAALSQLENAKESLRVLLEFQGLKKFIFISSVDVYPNSSDIYYDESSKIDLRDIKGIHSLTKLALEEYVMKNSRDFLILRPSLMLGKYSRDNSITRILSGKTSEFSLNSESTFNVISHESVSDFIEIALNLNLGGIYNLTSSSNISLDTVATLAGKKPIEFGSVLYQTPNLVNSKVLRFCKTFSKTSREFLKDYLEMTK